MDVAGYLIRDQKKKLEALEHVDARQRLSNVAKGLLFEFLLTSGGALKRPVVIDEEVYDGRLWDLAERVDLSMSQHTSHLLEQLQQLLLHRPSKPLHAPLLTNGDAFFYHALYHHLLGEPKLEQFCRALHEVSPFTRLCTFVAKKGHGELITFSDGSQAQAVLTREECRGLLTHPVLSFLLGYLADEWADIALPEPQIDLEQQLSKINTRRATLQLFMQELEALGRFSNLIVYPLFFMRLLRRRFTQQVSLIHNFKQWRLAARERLIFAHAGLLQLGDELDQMYRRQVVDPGPYGWSHPMEIRTFAGKYGRRWASGGLRDEVRQAERELRQEI